MTSSPTDTVIHRSPAAGHVGSRPDASPRKTIDRARGFLILGYVLCGYLVIKVALLAALGANTQYLMDEYDTISHVQYLDEKPYQDIQPPRTLLVSYLYWPANFFGQSSAEIMRLARVETVLIALASLALIYAIGRTIGYRRFEALLAVAAVVGFSSFMERAFTIRPEALQLLWACAALLLVCRSQRLSAIFAAGLLCGGAFLSGQKGIYFDLALGLGLVGAAMAERDLLRAIGWGAVLVLGWALAVGLYVGLFALKGAEIETILRTILMGSAVDNALSGHAIYEGLWRFKIQTLERNFVPYVICLSGLVMAAWRMHKRPRATRIAALFSLTIAVLVFGVHNAPWPYNFMLAIPFLGLWAPMPLIWAWRKVPERTFALTVLFVFVFAVSLARNVYYLGHDNHYQIEVMDEAEALLRPGDRYYDGVDMLPRQMAASRLWLERAAVMAILKEHEAGVATTLDGIFDGAPKVLILSYRTDRIGAALRPYLEHSYVRIAPNLMIAGARFDKGGSAVFVNRWPGRYRLFGVDANQSLRPLAVGDSDAAVYDLPTGRHRLALPPLHGASGTVLLPEDFPLTSLPRPDTSQRPLFGWAHGY